MQSETHRNRRVRIGGLHDHALSAILTGPATAISNDVPRPNAGRLVCAKGRANIVD